MNAIARFLAALPDGTLLLGLPRGVKWSFEVDSRTRRQISDIPPGQLLRIDGQRVKIAAKVDEWTDYFRLGQVVALDVNGGLIVNLVSGGPTHAGTPVEYPDVVGQWVLVDSHDFVARVIPAPPPPEIPKTPPELFKDDFNPADLIVDTSSAELTWEGYVSTPQLRQAGEDIVKIYLDSRASFRSFGVKPPSGALFSGQPGTGKTMFASIIAHESSAVMYLVDAATLGGQLVGDSEEKLQAIYDHASNQKLAVIFIDELDSITRDRSAASGSHADRLVPTFLINMDGARRQENVLTIGTTNRVDDIDPALRRAGRFGMEVHFDLPSAPARYRQLKLGRMRTRADISTETLRILAELTDGWSQADLDEIWRRAVIITIRNLRTRVFEDAALSALEHISSDKQNSLSRHLKNTSNRSRSLR